MKLRWTLDADKVLPEIEMPGGKRHHFSMSRGRKNDKIFEYVQLSHFEKSDIKYLMWVRINLFLV